ncbi:MAG: hypothetical protein HRT88_18760, partial [Lentisphaeraceae bacterium]|nr:hypothetical protein [Lentisphaeraceae bacterium]
KAPIISLDGDSPVNEDYLKAIFRHLENNKNFGAGHVNFKHRNCGTPEEKEAIRLYEKHLHQHRQNLEKACSPHAWYAIGSTIVCTKEAYQKSGGYNCRRMAGEDFYILQQLSKTGCKISMIEEAFVYPADRESQRVPFGTGKAVGDIIQDGNFMTYHQDCYKDLKGLLATITDNLNKDTATILKEAPNTCLEYLQERKFDEVWPKLQNNSRDNKMLLQRFHEWLDAFQTLKLIHHLSDKYYPRVAIS